MGRTNILASFEGSGKLANLFSSCSDFLALSLQFVFMLSLPLPHFTAQALQLRLLCVTSQHTQSANTLRDS